MNNNIIEINGEKVKDHPGNFLRETVEETLNATLEAEADQLCKAQKHERSAERQGDSRCFRGYQRRQGSWAGFLRYLKKRGLKSIDMIISDKSLGLVESIPDSYPKAKWQRCIVHYYRNLFSLVPHGRRKEVATMLKAIIHRQCPDPRHSSMMFPAFSYPRLLTPNIAM